jgi:hypothetical protein
LKNSSRVLVASSVTLITPSKANPRVSVLSA